MSARRPDLPGLVFGVAGAWAFSGLPFLIVKANRVVPGVGESAFDVLITGGLPWGVALLLLWLLAVLSLQPVRRLTASIGALAVLLYGLGAAASARGADGAAVLRIAPGPGFWCLTATLLLLLTDAVARLRLRAFARLLLLATALCALGLALGSGHFEQVSVMREYATNAGRFGHELNRHLALSFGSVLFAVAIGVPAGLACHGRRWLRRPMLAVLSGVQTVPSIALYGMLMTPLAALAAAWPTLADWGIGGIGYAPAFLALCLYALLPVVANTVLGLEGISEDVIEAARGMGLTERQVLSDIRWPLALPTIVTGVRVVLVQNIGLAAVAALVGGGGLGAFIFQGIGQTAIDLVLLGALPTVALALSAGVMLDAVVEQLQQRRAG